MVDILADLIIGTSLENSAGCYLLGARTVMDIDTVIQIVILKETVENLCYQTMIRGQVNR